MKQLKVYIDTSVVGGCIDEHFAEDSRALFQMARVGSVVLLVSDLLMGELQNAPEEVQVVLAELPSECVEPVVYVEEAEHLRNAYLSAKVVGENASNDALHVALATVCRTDLLVSWNFKHLVHLDRIRGFNAVNLREGYSTLEIRSPKEVV